LAGIGAQDPRWVDAILDWRWTWLTARVGLTVPYLVGGVLKLLDFRTAIAEQEHFGFHPGAPWAAAVILIEIIGPLLVIFGRFVWLAAGVLSVLTAVAACVAYPFWTMQGQQRFLAMNDFLDHIGLIAGFVLAALLAEHSRRFAVVPATHPSKSPV
jgi:uncharacterized membrane protein YphA (DoxX/SURF4 family)